jgi:hypothetical protein
MRPPICRQAGTRCERGKVSERCGPCCDGAVMAHGGGNVLIFTRLCRLSRLLSNRRAVKSATAIRRLPRSPIRGGMARLWRHTDTAEQNHTVTPPLSRHTGRHIRAMARVRAADRRGALPPRTGPPSAADIGHRTIPPHSRRLWARADRPPFTPPVTAGLHLSRRSRSAYCGRERRVGRVHWLAARRPIVAEFL